MNTLQRVDHLVFFHPSLEVGMEHLESLLGTRPVPGGHHPAFGTKNALLGLGDRVYLELLSPAPELPTPAKGRLTDRWTRPGLVGWAANSPAIDRQAAVLDRPVSSGSRMTPEGRRLTWLLTDIYAIRDRSALPFLIDWGDSPHPAESIPGAGRLKALELGDPDPGDLRDRLRQVGISLPVVSGRPRLRAVIETPVGAQSLEGPPG